MLDADQILQILKPNGALSIALKGFEPRDAQQKMLLNILDAYNNNAISLIEAGTGTGKSIAYLLPAILWALHSKERTLISTNTIALQEQLIYKDIPLLTKALKIDVKAVLVKGMNNYICLRKLADAHHELLMYSPDEVAELEKIDACKDSLCDGSKTDLPFVPSHATWEKVGAESDTCNHQECPFFQQCYFFKARRQANDAQILVANHHMLFADLACRAEQDNYKNPSILPVYSRIIIDEAHNIEDVATDYFASSVTRLGVMRIMSRLATDKMGKTQGKLPVLKEKLHEKYGHNLTKEGSSIFHRLNIELPGLRNDLILHTTNTFEAFVNFVNVLQPAKNGVQEETSHSSESKLRLLSLHKTHPDWIRQVVPSASQLMGSMGRYVQALNGLEGELKAIKNEKLHEQTKSVRFEITALAARLSSSQDTLANFMKENESKASVRWIEAQGLRAITNIHLINAELDIASRLASFLFSKFQTVILCSATLSTNKQFGFIRNRLGLTTERLPDRVISENIYESPFNYKKQALFAIPTDMPNPLDPSFTKEAAERIWQAIEASHGNAFVLFTSYSMLKTCHQLLSKRLEENRYVVFKQGDDNRKSLLNNFKETNRSVLFGTDSFWEGVDVVGDALRCVIIVKLPFKVPSEPIIQARTEAIIAEGGDAFMDYSLPNAIVKFKQGFGRLIRNKRDRGCIVCLDTRLITKGYGQQFLNSLPECQTFFSDSASLQKEMVEFYRKTYHFVAKN